MKAVNKNCQGFFVKYTKDKGRRTRDGSIHKALFKAGISMMSEAVLVVY